MLSSDKAALCMVSVVKRFLPLHYTSHTSTTRHSSLPWWTLHALVEGLVGVQLMNEWGSFDQRLLLVFVT